MWILLKQNNCDFEVLYVSSEEHKLRKKLQDIHNNNVTNIKSYSIYQRELTLLDGTYYTIKSVDKA